MKLQELMNESTMSEAHDIYTRAEEMAYEESANGNQPVHDDRIFAIAKQLISNEVRDPRQAQVYLELIAKYIHQKRRQTA